MIDPRSPTPPDRRRFLLMLGVAGLASEELLSFRPTDAAAQGDAAPAQGPAPEDGFTLHEWGVFTYYPDQAYANAGRDAAWKELPPEVFGVTPGRRLPELCVGADKPLIYLYNTSSIPAEPVGGQEALPVPVPGAKKEGRLFRWSGRKVELRVDFPGGAPLVWHPATSEPLGEWWGRGARSNNERGNLPLSRIRGGPDHLSWKLLFPVADALPPLACPAYAWKDSALRPPADPFSADYTLQDLQKFVFYEAMLPNTNRVSLRRDPGGDGLELVNAGRFAALDVYIVDRTGATPRLGYLPELPPTPGLKVVTTGIPDAREWNDRTSIHLRDRLCRGGGLFAPEAEGLAEIWRKEFFGEPGLHLLYRLPAEEYHRLLPLQGKPMPKKIVRVGLAWQPHLERDFSERITRLVERLRDNSIQERERAVADLRTMGLRAIPTLREHLAKERDPEVIGRLRGLVENLTTDPELLLKEWKRLAAKR